MPSKRVLVAHFGPVEVRLCAVERFAHFKCRRLLVRVTDAGADLSAQPSQPLLVSQYQLDRDIHWPSEVRMDTLNTHTREHLTTSESLARIQHETEFLQAFLELALLTRSETVSRPPLSGCGNGSDSDAHESGSVPPDSASEPVSQLVHDFEGRGRVALFIAFNELISASKHVTKFLVYHQVRCALCYL